MYLVEALIHFDKKYMDNKMASKMLKAADSYSRVAEILSEKVSQDQNPHFIIPKAINDCFAVEIYLKTLIFIESAKIIHTHILIDLFKELDPISKLKCSTYYKSLVESDKKIDLEVRKKLNLPPVKNNLKDVLEEVGNFYYDMKYIYEGNFGPYYHGRIIRKVFRKRIIDLYDFDIEN